MQNVTILDFEGPLDLLLHLVKKSKMDINEIKIVPITEQYIKFIKEMEELNLNIASEYLVMASELIEMKSRHLLPIKESEEETEEEIDAEEELKRRLLEYQKYKESTPIFKELEKKRTNYYTKIPENLSNITDIEINNDGSVTLNDLVKAFENILARQRYSKPINTKITRKELSVRERVHKIRNILKEKKKVEFVELFEEFSKPYVVVTFLGILEMAKNNEILITQKGNFDKIYLEMVI